MSETAIEREGFEEAPEEETEETKEEEFKCSLEQMEAFLISSVREELKSCLLYTSPSPRDGLLSRMPSSA